MYNDHAHTQGTNRLRGGNMTSDYFIVIIFFSAVVWLTTDVFTKTKAKNKKYIKRIIPNS